MSNEYYPLKEVQNVIANNLPVYLERIFKVSDEFILHNGIRIKKDNKSSCKDLKNTINVWEDTIERYRDRTANSFNLSLFDNCNEKAYEYNLFKDKVFSKHLWTVSAALSSKDPELVRYQEQFSQTPAKDIYLATYKLLVSASEYMRISAPEINFKDLKGLKDLKYNFLDNNGHLLTGVIGLGIRSEMLHRLYPSHFPMMTRRNLWGMYFLTDELDEFVIDSPPFDGMVRTQHNWNYDYKRFSYYNGIISNFLKEKTNKICGLGLTEALRFGYVNQFLLKVYEQHKQEVAKLAAWKYVGL